MNSYYCSGFVQLNLMYNLTYHKCPDKACKGNKLAFIWEDWDGRHPKDGPRPSIID